MSAEAKTIKCMSHSNQHERCRFCRTNPSIKFMLLHIELALESKPDVANITKRIAWTALTQMVMPSLRAQIALVPCDSQATLCCVSGLKHISETTGGHKKRLLKEKCKTEWKCVQLCKLNFTSLPFCSEWNCKVLSWMFFLFCFGASRCAFQSEKCILRKCSPQKRLLLQVEKKDNRTWTELVFVTLRFHSFIFRCYGLKLSLLVLASGTHVETLTIKQGRAVLRTAF